MTNKLTSIKKFDVCVVGSSAGGTPIACSGLLEGFRILVACFEKLLAALTQTAYLMRKRKHGRCCYEGQYGSKRQSGHD